MHPYDRVPYRGTAVPSASVRRLETIASLHGMKPVAPAEARVLELGCGTGANLLPLAHEYPGARVVGCDLSERAIESARAMAETLGVRNLELRRVDLLEIDEGWGEFDYIVCHDVFSWVAPAVQRKILDVYARNLAPRGIGYLSYDAYPGWRLHEVAVDMMRYCTRRLDDAAQVIQAARSMLAMAASVQDQSPDAYAALIRDEYWLLSAIPDEQLYHLISAEHHRPLYLHQFLDEIDRASLQWLGDADARLSIPAPRPHRQMSSTAAWQSVTPGIPESVRIDLDRRPTTEREQHLDFLSNRTFRRALVCRREVPVRSRPDPEAYRRLWIGLPRLARLETKHSTGEVCLSTHGMELRANDPGVCQALLRLEQVRPGSVAFTQLFRHANDDALDFMIYAFEVGAIEGVLTPHSLTNQIVEFPRVSDVVRAQMQHGEWITNQKSEPLQVTGLMRSLIQFLDGTHDRSGLADMIVKTTASDEPGADRFFAVHDPGRDPFVIADDCLEYARDHALLI